VRADGVVAELGACLEGPRAAEKPRARRYRHRCCSRKWIS
jgi:hypothetical protein